MMDYLSGLSIVPKVLCAISIGFVLLALGVRFFVAVIQIVKWWEKNHI